MGSSLSSEHSALSEIGIVGSLLSLLDFIPEFIATNQVLDTLNSGMTNDTSTSSIFSLLEHGLNCIRQEQYLEGITFFAKVREQLIPNLPQLAAVIDIFIQNWEKCWRAQQNLFQARKRFTEVDAKQRTQIAILEELLQTLMQARDTDNTLHAIPRTFKNSNDQHMEQTPLSKVAIVYPPEAHQQTISYVDENSDILPALYITCFCRFEVRRLGQLIDLCSNRNGQTIIRYLVAQPERRATMDSLMTVLWPEDESTVAHHKLQVAVSALRRSLNHGFVSSAGGGYILCKNRVYELNPLVSLYSDVDEFMEYYQLGRKSSGSTKAMYYERACDFYTGPFLSEDLYADWSFMQREQLNQMYVAMCHALAEYYQQADLYEDAMRWIGAVLKENSCDEVAHRQLIQVYVAQGRRSEALRQYQLCERILAEELGVQPMLETTSLFRAILKNENLPEDGTRIERK